MGSIARLFSGAVRPDVDGAVGDSEEFGDFFHGFFFEARGGRRLTGLSG
jgi:hypothetical protein